MTRRSRPAKLHSFRGQRLTAKEIAAITGIKERTVHRRLQLGQPVEGPPRMGPEPKRYDFRGERMTVREIMAATGLSRAQVSRRTDAGRFYELHELRDDFRDHPANCVMITHDGETLCMSAWARRLGVPTATVFSRLVTGWEPIKAITTPPAPHFAHRTIRQRNRARIRRIAMTFRNIKTGGQSKTFPSALGTGVGRSANDLQRGESL